MASVLLALLIVVMTADLAQSLNCYNCTSAGNSNCGVNFSTAGITTCQAETCTYSLGTYNGNDIVIRGCSPTQIDNMCQDVTIVVPVRACFCNTDLCNSQSPGRPSSASKLADQSLVYILMLAAAFTCIFAL